MTHRLTYRLEGLLQPPGLEPHLGRMVTLLSISRTSSCTSLAGGFTALMSPDRRMIRSTSCVCITSSFRTLISACVVMDAGEQLTARRDQES